MPKINFSHNWNNKLITNIFTTIRKSVPEKDKYYFNNLNKVFNIYESEKLTNIKAKLLNIDTRRFVDCDNYLLMLDIGEINMPKQKEIFKRFGIDLNTMIIILTFERI